MGKKKDYVISKGLVSLLENRYNLKLNKRIRSEIRALENQFVKDLYPYLKGKFNCFILDEEAINNSIDSLLKDEKRPVLSFDDVYLTERLKNNYNIFNYSIARLVNPDNFKDKKIGPRFGLSLDYQVEKLAKRYKGKDVVIFDIGIFTGKTLQSEIKRLKDNAIDVKKVYFVIGDKKCVNVVKNCYVKEVDVAYVYNFGEWIELRDFFGFDGKKVKREGIKEFLDYKDHKEIIIPFKENLSSWASIPKKYVKPIKRLCDVYHQKAVRVLSEKYKVIYKPIKRNINGTSVYLLDFQIKKD